MTEATRVEFLQGEIEGAFRVWVEGTPDRTVLHGWVAKSLWCLVCDHASGRPKVGVIPASVIREIAGDRLRAEEVEEEGVLQEDQEATVMQAVREAVASGRAVRPLGTGQFPDDWDLPEESFARIDWYGGDDGMTMSLPISGGYGFDEWGPFSAGVEVEDHGASWSEVFDAGGPAGDAPASGYALWDDEIIVLAGRCDDMEDDGYLAFRLGPGAAALRAGSRRWRAALASAAIMRGVPVGGDPYAGGFGFLLPEGLAGPGRARRR